MTSREKHYHKFLSFACLVFFLLFRLALSKCGRSVLTLARPQIFRCVVAALRPPMGIWIGEPHTSLSQG
nr:MAG TPA: hypothetical protein [Caudoviricetes sp.]